jgi:lipopolysaccharide/colanic/teichoic acid biosynthesis glycosyltransferase
MPRSLDWKRAEDLVLGTLLLLPALPLMLFIAIAIKLDSPGPVLFRQTRLGFNKSPFVILKFRTTSYVVGPERNILQAYRRVTQVGRLLRRTSLDELPQLINVLKGEMSLVGPRPLPALYSELYEARIAGYAARYRVPPGMTGWAEVNGFRGVTTLEKMQGRIDYDLAYIARQSLLFDFWILLLTVGAA